MTAQVDFDQVLLPLIGKWGVWQTRTTVICLLAIFAQGIAIMTWSFTAFDMKSRCRVPHCEPINAQFYVDGQNLPSFVDADHINNCQYHVIDRNVQGSNNNTSCEKEHFSGEVMTCDYDNVIFDDSIVTSSLSADFGLICDKLFQRDLLGATFMLGMLVGSFVIGFISDKFGRLVGLTVSIFLTTVSGTIAGLVNDIWTFGILRFLTGAGNVGIFVSSFVLVVEFMEAKSVHITVILSIPYVMGELALDLEAYFIRDWRKLQLVAHAPMITLLILMFFLDESPRWLMATGRQNKARRVITKIVVMNKRRVPLDFQWDSLDAVSTNQCANTNDQNKGVLDLLKSKVLLQRLINMSFQFITICLCYFGLAFASTSLSGDPYVNYCLVALVEIPGYTFCLFVMDRWGRRYVLIFVQCLAGIACVTAGLLQNQENLQWLQLIASLLGKFSCSGAFGLVFVYTAELFPTATRNIAVGICCMMARIGGALSFVTPFLKMYWAPLPLLVLGLPSVIAGIFAFAFPETKGQTLPDTMQDAINLGKNQDQQISFITFKKKSLTNVNM